MFLGPRRWGKSTFLGTLSAYYDKSREDSFEDTFGDLYIGKHPTKDRNSLLVLLLDFSSIPTLAGFQVTKEALNRVVCMALEKFLETNAKFLQYPQPEGYIVKTSAAESLERVIVSAILLDLDNDSSNKQQNLVEHHGERLFVGVDEYDAPANSCLFSSQEGHLREVHFQEVAEYLKTQFFAIVKKAYGRVIQKYWLTGVLPVFRDGVSPLAAVQIISMNPSYHGICGLTEEEVRTISLRYLGTQRTECQQSQEVHRMKCWYNGYQFHSCDGSSPSLFNPQLVFNHLNSVREHDGLIHLADEANATHSGAVLTAISADENRTITVHDLSAR